MSTILKEDDPAMHQRKWMLVSLTMVACTMAVSALLASGSELAMSVNGDIVLLDIASGERILLTQHRAEDWAPAWSPDGERIAFVSLRDRNEEIYVIDLREPDVLIRITEDPSSDRDPSWSSDGTELLFSSDRDGDFDIYRIALSGPGLTVQPPVRLTDYGGDDREPECSPDGAQIAFVRREGGVRGILLMSAEGEQVRWLTDRSSSSENPAWSPDGERIAFTSTRDGNQEIYVMDLLGENVQRLTDRPGMDWTPCWSPDGRQMAFASFDPASHAGRLHDVLVLLLGTREIVSVASTGADEWFPAWRPE